MRSFRGRTLIDIREFYTSGDQQLPGKKVRINVRMLSYNTNLKGISLTSEVWKELLAHVDDIQKAITELEGSEPASNSKSPKKSKKTLSEEFVREDDDDELEGDVEDDKAKTESSEE